MNLRMCITCGYLYKQDQPTWDALSASWNCPECGQSKENFDIVEIDEAVVKPPLDELPESGV
ncbi:MAG: hypothetical protein V3V31_16280 [Methylococcales bacterium]